MAQYLTTSGLGIFSLVPSFPFFSLFIFSYKTKPQKYLHPWFFLIPHLFAHSMLLFPILYFAFVLYFKPYAPLFFLDPIPFLPLFMWLMLCSLLCIFTPWLTSPLLHHLILISLLISLSFDSFPSMTQNLCCSTQHWWCLSIGGHNQDPWLDGFQQQCYTLVSHLRIGFLYINPLVHYNEQEESSHSS